jgi:predicted DNA-binding transcriptional regulator AlpA
MPENIPGNSLLRLPQVLAIIPISRSAWWAGVKNGRFPKPAKIGPRTSAWWASDIAAVLESIAKADEKK